MKIPEVIGFIGYERGNIRTVVYLDDGVNCSRKQYPKIKSAKNSFKRKGWVPIAKDTDAQIIYYGKKIR